MEDIKSTYAVICGYELDVHNFVGYPDTMHVQFIGQYLEFNDAAHIIRTLNEKGESDMNYFMLPQSLFAHYMQFDGECTVEIPHQIPFTEWQDMDTTKAKEFMEQRKKTTK